MTKPDPLITALADRWRAAEHRDQAGRLARAIDQAIELRDALETMAVDTRDHEIALSNARAGIDKSLTWLLSIADREGTI